MLKILFKIFFIQKIQVIILSINTQAVLVFTKFQNLVNKFYL